MLAEFSGELREIASIDTDTSDRIAAMLREMGEEPEEVYCIIDRYDRMRIEIYTEKPLRPESEFPLRGTGQPDPASAGRAECGLVGRYHPDHLL